MKKLTRLIIVGSVAAGVATIVVQRERLRELDRARMVDRLRGTGGPRFQNPRTAVDETMVAAITESPREVIASEGLVPTK